MTGSQIGTSKHEGLIDVNLSALRLRHHGNALFRRRLACPAEMVAVYHFTVEDDLDAIAAEGLGTRPPDLSSPLKRRMESLFAALAPAGRTRAGAVFAYPFLDVHLLRHQQLLVRQGSRLATIALQLRLDPSRAIVADTLLWNEAAGRVHFNEDEASARTLATAYWSGSMPLAEYLAIKPSERAAQIQLPEVLIAPSAHQPARIPPRDIRVYATLAAASEDEAERTEVEGQRRTKQ